MTDATTIIVTRVRSANPEAEEEREPPHAAGGCDTMTEHAKLIAEAKAFATANHSKIIERSDPKRVGYVFVDSVGNVIGKLAAALEAATQREAGMREAINKFLNSDIDDDINGLADAMRDAALATEAK